jgi:transposase
MDAAAKTDLASVWRQRVTAQQSAGESIRGWCKANGCHEHVRTILADDPMSGHLFVFRNRSSQRLKILWWDQDGYVLYYKRLERGTFQFPGTGGKSVAISADQLKQLLSGCPIEI